VLEGGIEAMLGRLTEPTSRARIRAEITGGAGMLSRGLGWEDVMIAYAPARPDAQGRRVSEIAASRGQEPLEAAMDLLVDEAGRGNVILFQLDEADFRTALVHPHVMIGSDGSSLAVEGAMAAGRPHPRSYGTFPRVLGHYARDERIITLPEAVRKMTGLPADRLGLTDRGVLRAGARADVVAFDAARIIDRATYEEPHRYAAGVSHVLVNGRVVVEGGEHTGALPGRVLSPS
jgi:N-acyl-D-aspartate/D-glutamate deacylase